MQTSNNEIHPEGHNQFFSFSFSVPHEVFTATVSNVGNCNVHRKCSLWQKVITIWGVHTTRYTFAAQ